MNQAPQQKTSLKMKQKMQLSAKLLQNVQLMRMSYEELQSYIQLQLEHNPFLNIEKTSNANTNFIKRNYGSSANAYNKFQEKLTSNKSTGENNSAASFNLGKSTHDVLSNTLKASNSLTHELIEQLALVYSRKSKQFAIGETIISFTDAHGFLSAEKQQSINKNFAVSNEYFTAVLKNVQLLEPCGVGCKDTIDFLCLQLNLKEEEENLRGDISFSAKQTNTQTNVQANANSSELTTHQIITLVRKYFSYLSSNKGIVKIKAETKFSELSIHNAIKKIAKLSPFPINAGSAEKIETFIVPEVSFKVQNGVVKVEIDQQIYPPISLDEKLLTEKITSGNKNSSKFNSTFLKQKYNEAKQALVALQFRKNTLQQVAELIAQKQRDYFLMGPHMLAPYTITNAATTLSLNKSTVSRLVTAKYANTPYGIVALRFFFSNSYVKFTPEKSPRKNKWLKSNLPSQGIVGRARILMQIEKIEKNFSGNKLSDEKVCYFLKKQGFNIARRTVNKYRREIFQRKAGGSNFYANVHKINPSKNL